MTGAAETSNVKPRLTTKEKGKGKRKRPAPITQADAEDDQDEDVVDTTKRQFTRRTRSKRGVGAQTLETSTQGLPSGLAIIPLPPALLDYQDLVPEGILQALDSFVPAPIPIVHRTRNRNAPVTDAEAGGSEVLRLKKELVIAQTTIEECDGVADERLEAMGMLNDEIKLWVKRCQELVRVLQVVEVERDNFQAGEGHAKELGTGLKVKLEDTGIEANSFEEHTSTPHPLDNTPSELEQRTG